MITSSATSTLRTPTQAADGIPRRRFSVADYYLMAEHGILGRDERVELIGGEIVAMSPKGRLHEVLRTELVRHWTLRGSPSLKADSEAPLRLADDSEPVPDILVYPASFVAPDVRGETALVVVEIADSSYLYGLAVKAPLYAANGVREYWVIHARTRSTKVHRAPGAGGYTEVQEIPSSEILTPLLAPVLAVRMADVATG